MIKIEEIWKWINKYENKYKISNTGKVMSYCRNKNIILKQKDIRDYKNVTLYENNKKHTLQVHRLVAEAFIPNPNNLPQVNHINGKEKWNNNIGNLEWCSNSDNIKHAYQTGLITQTGENNNATKLTDETVKQILIKGKYDTYKQMGFDYGIGKSTIEHILKRHTWTHIQ